MAINPKSTSRFVRESVDGQSAIDRVLERLDRVKKFGSNKWRARCPAHGSDRNQALSVADCDGRVLLHCFAGCSTEAVLQALSLRMGDLFDRPLGEHHGQRRRPWRPSDVIDLVMQESAVIAIVASDVLEKRDLSSEDYSRLSTAAARLNQLAVLVKS